MAQPTETYVDPSIAGDSGTGTIGDPYGDLEYCLEQMTRDATNGDRVNIKAGTDEILEFALNVTVDYGTPTQTAPLIFQGYTAAAGDLGIGGISGNGSVSIVGGNALDWTSFIDLHMHNTGSAPILAIDNDNNIIRCEVNNTNGQGISVDNNCVIMGCHVHDIGGDGIHIASLGVIAWNYIENDGTRELDRAIRSSALAFIYRNIIKVDGATDGIHIITGNDHVVLNNSIWSDGGTGQGIYVDGTNSSLHSVQNNIIEGFSGTGGIGFDLDASGVVVRVFAGNAAYNNATNYTSLGDHYLDRWGAADTNETLSASPFTSASTGDFSPVDTGSVKEGSLPADFGNGQ